MDVLLINGYLSSIIKDELEHAGFSVEVAEDDLISLSNSSVIIVDEDIIHNNTKFKKIKDQIDDEFIIAAMLKNDINIMSALINGCDDFFLIEEGSNYDKAGVIDKWVNLHKAKRDIKLNGGGI